MAFSSPSWGSERDHNYTYKAEKITKACAPVYSRVKSAILLHSSHLNSPIHVILQVSMLLNCDVLLIGLDLFAPAFNMWAR